MEKTKEKVNAKLEQLELVENELDIRNLSAKDYRQLMFRIELKQTALLEQIATTEIENSITLRMIAKERGIDIDKIIDEAFGKERQ